MTCRESSSCALCCLCAVSMYLSHVSSLPPLLSLSFFFSPSSYLCPSPSLFSRSLFLCLSLFAVTSAHCLPYKRVLRHSTHNTSPTNALWTSLQRWSRATITCTGYASHYSLALHVLYMVVAFCKALAFLSSAPS